MSAGFADSPRKIVVRQLWNTPLLASVHQLLRSKYYYFGLPGKDIHDVKLWREMIRKVTAFEIENEQLDNPRADIVTLNYNLSLLGIPYKVYCGFFENTLLTKKDDDNEEFICDDFVTLFNLDFCNSITGYIDTVEGSQCLRFAALREILSIQREIYRTSGSSRFVLLLTVHDHFHAKEMRNFIHEADKPQSVTHFLSRLPQPVQMRGVMQHSTPHLKAFVFATLRDYFRGFNVSSYFLPPVKYIGRTANSPMLHFTVLCKFSPENTRVPRETQKANDFLSRSCYRATDDTLLVEPCCEFESNRRLFDPSSAAGFFQN